MRANPKPNYGAGDGNRTHVISLEGWSSTIELHPQTISITILMVEGGGFEPPKAEPSDLQSDPFGHSGTPPRNRALSLKITALSTEILIIRMSVLGSL